MKGISPFISHAVFIGLSAFLIFAVLTVMNNMTNQYRTYATDIELEQLCFTIRSSLEKIYVESNYATPTNTTYGKINVNLPEQMGGENFLMRFTGQNIYIEALNGLKNITCYTRFDFSYHGSTTGGMTEIKYTYYDNGTKKIDMTKL